MSLDDASLTPWESDLLLSGGVLTEGASDDARAVQRVVMALRAPGHAEELSGEAEAVAAFVAAASSFARRSILGFKLAVAATAASLVMGGVAAASVGGHLPEPLQVFAHVMFGAPPPAEDASVNGGRDTSRSDVDASPSVDGPGRAICRAIR